MGIQITVCAIISCDHLWLLPRLDLLPTCQPSPFSQNLFSFISSFSKEKALITVWILKEKKVSVLISPLPLYLHNIPLANGISSYGTITLVKYWHLVIIHIYLQQLPVVKWFVNELLVCVLDVCFVPLENPTFVFKVSTNAFHYQFHQECKCFGSFYLKSCWYQYLIILHWFSLFFNRRTLSREEKIVTGSFSSVRSTSWDVPSCSSLSSGIAKLWNS